MTKKAFTLIELLVVIAIIALLLAIIVPSLSAVKEYASILNCLSSQKNISLAYIMYTGDNDDKFCSGNVNDDPDVEPDDNPNDDIKTVSWVRAPIVYNGTGYWTRATDPQLNIETRRNGLREGAIFPYLEDVTVFHCLGDKRLRKGAARYFTDSSPDPLNVYQIYRSYGMPDFYMAGNDNNQSMNDADEYLLTNIRAPGSKLLFVEDNYDKWYNTDGWSYRPNTMEYWDPLGNYHNRSCTFSFVDGHGEHYKWRDARSDFFMGDREGAKNGANNPIEPGEPFGKNDTQDPPFLNPDHTWLDRAYPCKTRRKGGQ